MQQQRALCLEGQPVADMEAAWQTELGRARQAQERGLARRMQIGELRAALAAEAGAQRLV